MIDYIVIGLLVVLLGLLLYILINIKNRSSQSNEKNQELKAVESELKLYFQKEYGELKVEMTRLFADASKTNLGDLIEFKDKLVEMLDGKFKDINERVDNKLGEGFKNTEGTFRSVIDSLARIDEAQKRIDKLSTEVFSLNGILTDKKTRGVYGEIELNWILTAALGDNEHLFEKQKKLSNDCIADVVINAPDPIGKVAIDSKFPLENYRRMINRDLGDADKAKAEKDFKNDVKVKIDDIKSKYIIENETSDQAFMFIPAEAIFAEITAHHEDLIKYSLQNKVYIVSPTTLFSTLTMIRITVERIEATKNQDKIRDAIKGLKTEFERYIERWGNLQKSIDSVSKDVRNVAITSNKISNKFVKIASSKFDEVNDKETDDDYASSEEI